MSSALSVDSLGVYGDGHRFCTHGGGGGCGADFAYDTVSVACRCLFCAFFRTAALRDLATSLDGTVDPHMATAAVLAAQSEAGRDSDDEQ